MKKTFTCLALGCEKKEYATNQALKRHIISQHPEEAAKRGLTKKNFSCPQCGKELTQKTYLKNHITSQHPEEAAKQGLTKKKFICPVPYCKSKDNSFADNNSLKRHITNFHPEEAAKRGLTKKNFSCPHCSKEISQKAYLKNHIARMHPEKAEESNLNIQKKVINKILQQPYYFPPVSSKYMDGSSDSFVNQNIKSNIDPSNYSAIKCLRVKENNIKLTNNLPPNKKRYIFVLLGRVTDGFFPQLNDDNISVLLVITKDEKEKIRNVCDEAFLYCDGESIRERRLAVWNFAYKNELQHFIMLDDNINSVMVNKSKEVNSWESLYGFLYKQCDKQFVVGMNNIYGKSLMYPSKLLFFKTKSIFDYITQEYNSNIEILLPRDEDKDLPLEDYYTHFALMLIYQQMYQNKDNFLDYRLILNKKDAGYKRENKTIKNSVIKSLNYKRALSWKDKVINKSGPFSKADLLNNNIIILMKKTIEEALSNHDYYTNLDFILAKFNKLNNISNQLNTSSPQQNSNKLQLIKQKMRDYQKEAISAVDQSTNRIDILKLPTGAGKTIIEFFLAIKEYSKNKDVFVITSSVALTSQIFDNFHAYCNDFGIKTNLLKIMSEDNAISETFLNDNFFEEKHAQNKQLIYIFCYESFLIFCKRNKNKEYVVNTLRIFDECDVMFNPKKPTEHNNLLLDHKTKSILLSATPYKYEGMSKYTYEAKIKDLINKHRVVSNIKINEFKTSSKDLTDNQLYEKMILETINDQNNLTKKGIIYTKNVSASIEILRFLQEKKVDQNRNIIMINNAVEDLDKKLAQIKDTKEEKNANTLIIAVKMLTRGYDNNQIGFIIFARKLPKKERNAVQMVGRLSRLNSSIETKEVYLHTLDKNSKVSRYWGDKYVSQIKQSKMRFKINDQKNILGKRKFQESPIESLST
ncbi:superfamily II DNA or RNA helicase [Allofrancisella inopinata]|uniref:DEAD/DEAH box helicase n=1 Tax=Allofrancisella inopinata TaxID=1085647 RepID=A0AAE7CQX6_9GAMM|nr:DEAD/DEAH box helicase [Allofrancisella inopinata]QIV96346.1 DEAD/DEAH box helicase [Allofrancisella inopinata]TDT67334.1 superfamily II DNA or RNA helicase [Allofrancisella inopinata]